VPRLRAGLIFGVLCLGWMAPEARAAAPYACPAGKLTAAAAAVKARLRCHDPISCAKVKDRLEQKFARLKAKSVCLTTGDADVIADIVVQLLPAVGNVGTKTCSQVRGAAVVGCSPTV
jgi:hypothetical protein